MPQSAQEVNTTPREGATKVVKKKPRKKIKVHLLSDIEPEEVNWLWYPYIPAGKLSIIEGDPGMGKSFITCALAADISQGRKLPGQKEALPPQKVLMLSAEDGLGDTVRPRIEAMNGDMTRIFVSDDYFILDKDGLEELEDLMKTVAATIVFMDPIVAYMGGKVDMHKANEVRALMTPLSEIAKTTGCAIVAVRHLRKGSNGKRGKAIYSGIGSIDFTAAVRSVMQVGESKGGTKFIFHAKHNLSPPGDTLAYEINDGKFQWQGTVDPADLQDFGKTNTKPRMQAIAEQFLFDFLKDGAKSAIAVYEAANAARIPKRTLDRAKKGIVHSEKWENEWVWILDQAEGMGK